MAFLKATVRSRVLEMDTGLCLVLPHDHPTTHNGDTAPGAGKLLYLLHGMGENCEAWTRFSRAERYAYEKGVTLVMPEVQRSFYRDMAYGPRYFTYITEELPEICRDMFGLDTSRENSYIAGLSMGGYGALVCALSYPERYRGCASFSGAVDIHYVAEVLARDEHITELRATIGTDLLITAQMDIWRLAEKAAKLPTNEQPELFLTCGEQDFLYDCNRRLHAHMQQLGLTHEYRTWAGVHEWGFWDESLKQALAWFFPAGCA